jgi:hypothetical protein
MLIMAANDITNALRHPHPEVPLAHVGDDTITALTQLAEIFKNKFQKLKSPELSHKTFRFETAHFSVSHVTQISNKVTNNN